jgi:hypothetical protein
MGMDDAWESAFDKAAFDDDYADYAEDEALGELRAEAIAEFQQERLSSYYTEHPEVAQPAIDRLKEAQALFDAGFVSASLVFAISAAEHMLTYTLLRPIIYGLVHDEFAAELVARVEVRLGDLPKLLFPIIAKIAKVDLSTYRRHDQRSTLWQEFRRLQEIRHGVLHRGKNVGQEDASAALAVSRGMFTDVVEPVMSAVAP